MAGTGLKANVVSVFEAQLLIVFESEWKGNIMASVGLSIPGELV